MTSSQKSEPQRHKHPPSEQTNECAEAVTSRSGDNNEARAARPAAPSPAGADDLELAILGWVDWFNHRWIHAELDYRTPAEIGTEHYRVHNETAQQPRADYQAL